jgi:DNA mismatch endonuclease, patch repair protein
MTDIVNTKTRSRMMSGIRGRNTRPEMLISRLLREQGFQFHLHAAGLRGKPDIVLPHYQAVIFVHGCFWHGHDCSLFRLPGTRPEFWRKKISSNRSNDAKVMKILQREGWRICIVWECAIRGAKKDINRVACHLREWLQSGKPFMEEKG